MMMRGKIIIPENRTVPICNPCTIDKAEWTALTNCPICEQIMEAGESIYCDEENSYHCHLDCRLLEKSKGRDKA